ncbi:MAG TPA: hypothetical protein VKV17_16430, partial [Bryobacteraceae bacterium]|nr:hypothetical protein [Bryobacteraceae bacterium]
MQRTDTSSGIRMAWYRVYHGMPYDPKFAVIAKRCGAKRGDVVAVWLAALDFASQHKGRGSIEGIDAEEIAVSLEYETEYVSGILRAFEDRGMIASSRLAAWERRQVQREREDNSTERVRAYRQRQKGQPQATEELVYRRGFFCPKSVDFGTMMGHEETALCFVRPSEHQEGTGLTESRDPTSPTQGVRRYPELGSRWRVYRPRKRLEGGSARVLAHD